MKLLIGALLIVVYACVVVEAQDRSSLSRIVESNITSMLPEFTLEHSLINENTAGFVWAHDKDVVFIWIEFYQTTERARGSFVSKPLEAELEGFKVNLLEKRVHNLGYDNYWSEDVSDGKEGLHFYRGKVAVLVTAPSDEMAERVARQIDLLLPDA